MSEFMTKNGVTTCNVPGMEKYESYFTCSRPRKKMFAYDYRYDKDNLFSCVKPSLKECREARDKWLENNGFEIPEKKIIVEAQPTEKGFSITFSDNGSGSLNDIMEQLCQEHSKAKK